MATIKIQNVGAIKLVNFRTNKINVFIGPQSSGKSTIAKILSFCSWLEKEVVTTQNIAKINQKFVDKNLKEFHRIESYFNETSVIEYEGDAIKFSYINGKTSIEKLDSFDDAVAHRTSYIPAERIIASVPLVRTFEMQQSSLRSFLFDWWKISSTYTKDNALSLPDMEMVYYHDPEQNKDIIRLSENEEIDLSSASSGLQSIVPLYATLKYSVDWVYEHESELSFDKSKEYDEAVRRRYLRMILSNTKDEDIERLLNDTTVPSLSAKDIMMLSQYENVSSRLFKNEKFFNFFKFVNNITKTHYTNVIIEEPELNLFPCTQVELMYDIVKMMHPERDNVVITTHSPYILYALNNCMLASRVNSCNAELLEQIDYNGGKVDSSIVSVWELREGRLVGINGDGSTIQDEDGLIRDNYFDRIMGNVMSDFRNLLSVYESSK